MNWGIALRDRTLVTFLLANTFFAIYGAQLSSTLPLYLANFVPAASVDGNVLGFSEQLISYLFFFHALIKIIGQLPITRWVKQIDHVSVLLFTLVLWAGSATFFWLAGVVAVGPVLEISIAALSSSPWQKFSMVLRLARLLEIWPLPTSGAFTLRWSQSAGRLAFCSAQP